MFPIHATPLPSITKELFSPLICVFPVPRKYSARPVTIRLPSHTVHVSLSSEYSSVPSQAGVPQRRENPLGD